MDINKAQLNHNNFIANPSIDESLIEEIEVALDSKPNVFSNYNIKPQPSTVPVEKPKIPLKRLDTMDNSFLLPGEKVSVKNVSQNRDTKEVNHVWKSFKSVFKGFLSNVPIINSFMLLDKQNKLKATIKDLSYINSNVDELMSMSFPREEDFDKYKIISENLIKANNLHSQIIKEIKE